MAPSTPRNLPICTDRQHDVALCSFDYVQQLSSYTVNGYSTIVGLAPGVSGATLEQRVDKWFLGADHPRLWDLRARFRLMFVNGPAYTDIHQGELGDCSFLASLAETALNEPSIITNMFVANGDSTYTVRSITTAWLSTLRSTRTCRQTATAR